MFSGWVCVYKIRPEVLIVLDYVTIAMSFFMNICYL